MISRRAFAFAAPFAAFSIQRLRAAGVDGKWEAEVPGGQSPVVVMFDLKADGEALRGTVGNDAMGTSDIADGKISGDTVSFIQVISRGNRQIRFQYEGKLMGDEMELTRSMVRPAGQGGGAGGQRGQGGAAGGQRGQGGAAGGQRGQGGAAGGQRGQGGGGQAAGARQGGGIGARVTFTAKRVG